MSESELDITMEQWRDELYRQENVPGHTAAELANEFGFSESKMRRKLKMLVYKGKCTIQVGSRADLNGVRRPVNVYQIKE